MTRTRAIFFDVGGTLLDMGDPEAAYRDVLRRYGYDVSPEQLHAWVVAAQEASRRAAGPPASDYRVDPERSRARRETLLTELLRQANVTEHLEACGDGIRESWIGTQVFHSFPETASVLSQLKQAGFVLGTVSNWESRLAALCANHGIAQYFDFILASESEGYAKPSTRLFEIALARAGVTPDEAAHVGDSMIEDIQTAESLGIRAVMIQRRNDKPIVHSPTITSLEMLLPLVTADTWLRGRVVGGKGEAAGFTNLPWVLEQAQGKLGFEPYPGTLNVHVEGAADLAIWAAIRCREGIPLEPRLGFCAARCYPVSVEGRAVGAIVYPLVPNYPPDVVEVIAPVSLRQELSVADGSPVTLALTA